MATKIVLIADYVHEHLITSLHQIGYDVKYIPDATARSMQSLLPSLTGLLINSRVVADKALIDASPQLNFIGRIGSGLEIIDVEYATTKGIKVLNAPEGNRNAVAEHAMALLLNLMNNINVAAQQVSRFEWLREQNRGTELSGKTVALIAFGNTGRAFAKLLSSFDVHILAYDKYLPQGWVDGVKLTSLNEIYEQADVVSIHLPLTEETKYFVDQHFLNKFKKPIWLINTARGKVLDTRQLLQALDNKKVIAAGLDVMENEQLHTYTQEEKNVLMNLTGRPNVIVTPHIAGWTHESKLKIAQVLADKIASLPRHN